MPSRVRVALRVFKALFDRIHHTDSKSAARSRRAVGRLLAGKPDLLEALGLEVPRRPGRPRGSRSIPFREAATVKVAIDYVRMLKADVIRALGREATRSNIKWIDRRLDYGRTAPTWWLESVLLRHLRGRPKAEQEEIMRERLAYYRKK